MAYTALDTTKPNTSQTRTASFDSARANQAALRDAIVAGVLQGFNYSVITGTNDAPTKVYFTRGSEVVRLDITWSTGRVTKVAFYYSDTGSGGPWDNMADGSGYYVLNISYDGSDNVSSTNWNATP